ncbi:hypothetical protein AHF37_10941 [Paragonimus kellicotti]|nr:hypothetical protein AHF37_10941 [Paragonimus kellicotti]
MNLSKSSTRFVKVIPELFQSGCYQRPRLLLSDFTTHVCVSQSKPSTSLWLIISLSLETRASVNRLTPANACVIVSICNTLTLSLALPLFSNRLLSEPLPLFFMTYFI